MIDAASVAAIAVPFLAATVRTATPLALAAFGELLVERTGLINIGLEGAIIAGAFGALVGAGTGGLAGGWAGAAAAGLLVGALFALCVIALRADQIITGIAITLLGLGATGTLYRALYGSTGAALRLPTSVPWSIPGLSTIPVVGQALFAQPPVTYLAYLTDLIAGQIQLTFSPIPNALPYVKANRLRTLAVLVGGSLGGLAGGTLVLAQAGTFAENMSAGRGFIAIAIVVLGRWRPVGIVLGALLFGGASALQFAFQAMGWNVPYQLFLGLPYVLTLAVLAGAVGQARAPAALGKAI